MTNREKGSKTLTATTLSWKNAIHTHFMATKPSPKGERMKRLEMCSDNMDTRAREM